MNLSSIRSTFAPLAAALAVAAGSAHAGIVYQQAPGDGISTGWTSHIGTGQGGFQAFDDFKVGSNARIDKVSWRGTYFTAESTGLQGAAPNTSGWTVEFWSGNAAGPLAQLYSQTYSAAAVTRRFVSTVGPGGLNADLYDFSLDLALDFDVLADQQYWFSVISKASNFSPFFSWTNADPGGSTFQRMFDGGGRVLSDFVRGGDRAFALESAAVPEPASLALVAAALVAAGAASRRRRAA